MIGPARLTSQRLAADASGLALRLRVEALALDEDEAVLDKADGHQQALFGGDMAIEEQRPVRAHLRRAGSRVVAVPAYVRMEQVRGAEFAGPPKKPIGTLAAKAGELATRATEKAAGHEFSFENANQNTARRQRMAAPHAEEAMDLRDRAARWTRWSEKVASGEHSPTRFEELILGSSAAFDAARYNHRRILGDERYRQKPWTQPYGVTLGRTRWQWLLPTRAYLEEKRRELSEVRAALSTLRGAALPLSADLKVARDSDWGLPEDQVRAALARVAGIVPYRMAGSELPWRPIVLRDLDIAAESIARQLRVTPEQIARAEEGTALLGEHLQRDSRPGYAGELRLIASDELLALLKSDQVRKLFHDTDQRDYDDLLSMVRERITWGDVTYEGAQRNAQLFQAWLDLTERDAPEAPVVHGVDRSMNRAPLDVRMAAAERAEAHRWIPANLQGIPEFFETPPTVGVQMVDFLDLQPGQKVLESSAGRGGLADLLPDDVQITVAEASYSLREVLAAKGYTNIYPDALEVPSGPYDAFLINPPFSDEIAHFRAAYARLKPGGRFAAILSSALMFRRDHEALLSELQGEIGAELRPLGPETFKRSGTSVPAVLVLGAKPRQ